MIKIIYTLEISGVCNLGCVYCPYRLYQRSRGLMSMETLSKTLDLIRSGKMTANKPLFLHLFGEPLMHDRFEEMAREVKKEVDHISFSTNGIRVTKERARVLADIGFSYVTVSPHLPSEAMAGADILTGAGIDVKVHGGPDHTWGGQVSEAPQTMWHGRCEFKEKDKVVIRWNGDVAVCCIDDSDSAVIGSVHDENVEQLEHRGIPLCKTCHLGREGCDDGIHATLPAGRIQPVSWKAQ